ncbi:MAG: ATP-dependent Clp protease proteolytic subunit [Candidatus Paceibacterota bacterium]|jgi:ATP-dependent Clp protease protease subunit
MNKRTHHKTHLYGAEEGTTFLLPKNQKNEALLYHLDKGVLYLNGEVNEDMVEYVQEAVLTLSAVPPEDGVLTVKISSLGGDADAGFEIHDLLMLFALETKTVVKGLAIGKAMSAAAMLILQGCTVRLATENSTIMCHNALTGMIITEHDLKSAGWHIRLLRDLENLKKRAVTILMRRTKKSERDILKLLARARFMTAGEALEFGLLDGILEFKMKEPEETAKEGEPTEAVEEPKGKSKLSNRLSRLFKKAKTEELPEATQKEPKEEGK